jgi:SiaC family regulatory phosphoprotein
MISKMENLFIALTDDTPEINFQTNGHLFIKGVSIPENIKLFYVPIIDWLNALEQKMPPSIQLVFEIEYINTATSYMFIEIIRKVNAFKKSCPNTTITWRYEDGDDDIFDLGKDLEHSTPETVFQFEII